MESPRCANEWKQSRTGVVRLAAACRAVALAVPPALAALFPLVLLVRTHVITHVFSIKVIARPAAALVGSALLVLVLFRVLLRSTRVASLATTLFFIEMGLFPLLFTPEGRWDWLLATAFVAASIGLALAAASYLDGSFGAVIGGTVAVIVASTIAAAFLISTATWPRPSWVVVVDRMIAAAQSVELPDGHERPDIYYVVLDGMARADVLDRLFAVNAAPAIAELEALGVQVPRRSRSNYSMTQLSLASSLNMQYLTPLSAAVADKNDRRPLHQLTARGGVMALLKRHGYEFVVVGSAALIAFQHADADRCLCSLPDGPTELEHAWLSRTPVRGRYLDRAALGAHRRKVLHSLELIESVRSDRPMFVMAHLMVPHPPFVFAATGMERMGQDRYSFSDGDHFPGSRGEYLAGYRAQATFVLRRVVELIERLAARSPRSVIIVHSDHGSGLGLVNNDASRTDSSERFAIFSAYYAGRRDATVPDDISPVNALRWALNAGLGAELPLLPNRSYVSDYIRPYQWREIPDEGILLQSSYR
jgi:hypothetical protein